jgi:hypothetical protein
MTGAGLSRLVATYYPDSQYRQDPMCKARSVRCCSKPSGLDRHELSSSHAWQMHLCRNTRLEGHVALGDNPGEPVSSGASTTRPMPGKPAAGLRSPTRTPQV